jgi:hypothetical protein
MHDGDPKYEKTLDLTSGPGAPDLELLFAPLIVLDHGRRRETAFDGLTLVSLLLIFLS